MPKYIFTFLFLFFVYQLKAQFYYTDIIGTQNTNNIYVSNKENKIKKIIVKNLVLQNVEDANNKFVFKQYFSRDYSEVKCDIQLPNGGERTYTNYFNNNKIIKKEDAGLNINSLVRYEYDGNNLTALKTSSVDTSIYDGFYENHFFEYDAKGLPTKMYKIKNNVDTTTILFVKDEQGNIGEERWYKKDLLIETYYYYYNEKKFLTDIVRFNEKYQKMLPEFLFEYNDNNLIIQMNQIPYGSSNYTTIKYEYNDKSLKIKESIFTKKGELLNALEYIYE